MFLEAVSEEKDLGVYQTCRTCGTAPDYGLGTVGKCLGPTTSKGPTKDGCKIC